MPAPATSPSRRSRRSSSRARASGASSSPARSSPGEVEVDVPRRLLRVDGTGDGVDDGAIGNVAETERFTVQQLTADLADPPSGRRQATSELNDRGFFDVVYTVPAYATTLDLASVTDARARVHDRAGRRLHRHDPARPTRPPVLVEHTTARRLHLPLLLHGHAGARHVELTFIGGGVLFRDAAGDTMPLFAPREVDVVRRPGRRAADLVIDVPFGTPAALDVHRRSAGTDITIAGATLTVRRDAHRRPLPLRRSPRTGIASGTKLVVSYVNGAAGRTAATGRCRRSSRRRARSPSPSGTYIDVVFTTRRRTSELDDQIDPRLDRAERGRDPRSTGPASAPAGRWCSSTRRRRPTILADGRTVRYYLTGAFVAGQGRRRLRRRLVAGRGRQRGRRRQTRASTLVEPVEQAAGQTPTASSSSTSRARWSCGSPTSSTSRSSRSAARSRSRSATARSRTEQLRRLPTGTARRSSSAAATFPWTQRRAVKRFRFALRASGTIKVIKLGNIASGAAVVRAREGRRARRHRVLGRRRLPDELRVPRAVRHLPRRAARCSRSTRPTASSARRSRSRASRAASSSRCPTGRLRDARSRRCRPTRSTRSRCRPRWIGAVRRRPRLGRPRRRRHRRRRRRRPSRITLDTGQLLKLEPTRRVHAENATIEGIVAGKKWRIKIGDGRQFFIEKTTRWTSTATRRDAARPRRGPHVRARAALVRRRRSSAA